jgi:hypothetical protein
VSWVFGLLWIGGGLTSLFEQETSHVALVALVTGPLMLPPVVQRLRRSIPAFRPFWAPPVIAIALHFCLGSIVKLVEPNTPPPVVATASKPEAPEAISSMEKEASGYGGFVKQLVGRQLLDAESAQFTDGRAYRTDNRRSFCGSVNGKNRFGGYVGPQPYVIAADGQVYVGPAATADIVFRECQGKESAAFRVW